MVVFNRQTVVCFSMVKLMVVISQRRAFSLHVAVTRLEFVSYWLSYVINAERLLM